MLVISLLLWQHSFIYRFNAVFQVAFYSWAGLGIVLRKARAGRMKIFALPSFFCLVNVASLMATINVLRGHRIDRWEPQRRTGTST